MIKMFLESLVRGEVPLLLRPLRLPLYPLSWIYHCLELARLLLYDFGLLPVRWVDVPVISVGNLSSGGTGKTPLVLYIARFLSEKGLKPAVVSRGYGAPAGKLNDEAKLVEAEGFPVFCHPNRFRAAEEAVRNGAKIIILDDGFQHMKLYRDMDIVTIDASRPPWEDQILPAGTLRDPLIALTKVEAAVITRADPDMDVSSFIPLLNYLCTGAPVAVFDITPHLLVAPDGTSEKPDVLAGRKVAAFCGTASPERFRTTLEKLGAKVVAFTPFPDHHIYTAADLEAVERLAEESGAEFLVCTAKDAVKCSEIDRPRKHHILQIRLQPAFGAEELEKLILEAAELGDS